eukprot:UN21768
MFNSPENRDIAKCREGVIKGVESIVKLTNTLVDVGAGTGLFVEPFSNKVGDKGTLHCLEISDGFIEHLNGLVKEKRLRNR